MHLKMDANGNRMLPNRKMSQQSNGSMMSRDSNSTRRNSFQSQSMTPKPFINEWCSLYGVDPESTEYLQSHGYHTGEDILKLYVQDINKLELSFSQRCVLRGAVLQYRQSRLSANKELAKRGVNIPTPVSKRDLKGLWQKQAGKVATMDTIVMAMLKPEERERIRELRRRLHTKRKSDLGNLSLYEKIMQRRRSSGGSTGMVNGSVSDGSESLSSRDSFKSMSPIHDGFLPPIMSRRKSEDMDSDSYHTASCSTPVLPFQPEPVPEEESLPKVDVRDMTARSKARGRSIASEVDEVVLPGIVQIDKNKTFTPEHKPRSHSKPVLRDNNPPRREKSTNDTGDSKTNSRKQPKPKRLDRANKIKPTVATNEEVKPLSPSTERTTSITPSPIKAKSHKPKKTKVEEDKQNANCEPMAPNGNQPENKTQPKTEKLTRVQIEQKLDNVLKDLDSIGKGEVINNGPPLSPKESARQTELAIKRLEEELFTEEELELLAQYKMQQEMLNNNSHNGSA